MVKKCKSLVLNYRILPSGVLVAFSHKTHTKIMHESARLVLISTDNFSVSQHLKVPAEMLNPSNAQSQHHTE
jgi:hypothetical protein